MSTFSQCKTHSTLFSHKYQIKLYVTQYWRLPNITANNTRRQAHISSTPCMSFLCLKLHMAISNVGVGVPSTPNQYWTQSHGQSIILVIRWRAAVNVCGISCHMQIHPHTHTLEAWENCEQSHYSAPANFRQKIRVHVSSRSTAHR